MSYLTCEEIVFLELGSGLHRVGPFLIRGVMNTQLSIARYYGGIDYNGQRYTYLPEHDELIRDDVLKAIVKRRNGEKEPSRRKRWAKKTEAL